MNITETQAINYLIDVVGYSEQDACYDISRYGIEGSLTIEQTKECTEFNK